MNATPDIDGDPPLGEIVDLERYPLDRPRAAALRDVIAHCRSDLETLGCSVLDGFFAPGVEEMRREAAALVPRAYFKERYGNPYSSADDPSLPATHPVRTFLKRDQGFVAGDLIDEGGAMKRVYRDARFRRFVAACLGLRRIHEYADPLGCLVVNVIRDGATHPWHFDTNEFVVSTLVQAPEAGGLFEYCPQIRSPENENFERVASVIHGEDRSRVRTLTLRPGDIQLFKGRFSLHRVAPVEKATPRLSVIFSYSLKPGMIAKAERTRYLFGRVTDAHREQAGRAGRADALID